MKTLHDLQEYFDPELHEALEEWYEKFTEDTGQRGLRLFLAYLKQRNLVTSETMVRLRGQIPVDVSEMERMAESTGFIDAATSMSSSISLVPPPRKTLPDNPQLNTIDLEDDEDGDTQWGGEAPKQLGPVGLFGLESAMTVDAPEIQTQDDTPVSIEELDTGEMLGDDDDDETRIQLSGPPSVDSEASSEASVAYEATVDASSLKNALAIEDPHHEIHGELGRGAMGVVFLAHEQTLNRKVAFKQIRPDTATERELMMRFLREAQITAQLDHPAIIPVYALVKGFKGLPAYTMKVVEGVTLDVIIRETREAFQAGRSVDEEHALTTRLEHFLKVCDAMAYAHSKGVLHRDLKPKNILVGRFGEAYLVDWGLARLMFSREESGEDDIKIQTTGDYQTVKTQVGRLMGTPQYMSPEQAQGQILEMDGRSDIYSLGVILYELVFLEKAIEGDNLLEVVNKVVKGELREIPEQSPYERIPRDLPAIIRKATAADKEKRYETARKFADAVRSCLLGDSIVMTPPSVHRSRQALPPPAGERRPSYAGWIACGLLLVMFFAGMLWLNSSWKDRSYKASVLAEEHRTQLLRRMAQSAAQATSLERFFLRIEGLVQGLNSAAHMTLTQGQVPKRPKYYLHRSFTPPDLVASPFYRDEISRESPSIRVYDGKSLRKHKALLGRLSLLKGPLRTAVYQSLPTRLKNLSLQAKDDLLSRKGFPLLSSFVALPQEILVVYPGRSGDKGSRLPSTYPWYQIGKRHSSPVWTPPHVSQQKIRAVVISCVSSFRDELGLLSGVSGIHLRLNTLAQHLESSVKSASWINEAILLDHQGHVLVKTRRRLQDFVGQKLPDKGIKMPVHPKSELVKALRQRHASGYLKLPGGKQGWEMYTYHKLKAVNWYFVTVSDWRY